MLKRKPSPAVILASLALFFSLGGASLAAQPGSVAVQFAPPAYSVVLTAGTPARWEMRAPSSKQVTPCVYVGRDPLLIADLTDHSRIATYYGDGTVARVRLMHHGQIVRVTAVTVNQRERVRFRLVRGTASC